MTPDGGNNYPDAPNSNMAPPFIPDVGQFDMGYPPFIDVGSIPDTGVHPDADPIDTGVHPDPIDSGVHPDAESLDAKRILDVGAGDIETVDSAGCGCAVLRTRASSSLGVLLLGALLWRPRRRKRP